MGLEDVGFFAQTNPPLSDKSVPSQNFPWLTDLDEPGPAQVAQFENQVRNCDNYLLVLEERFGYTHTSDKLGLVDWMDTPNIHN
jgi:hypothetical protein